jgi:YD repeat-containing protein
LDASYTNTFDGAISTAITVSVWAKGSYNSWGNWPEWIGKYGDNGQGWSLRGNSVDAPCFTVRDNNAGTLVVGDNLGWDGNDDCMAPAWKANDNNWHHYAGTYSALTGVRKLYMDGQVVAWETGNTAYGMAPGSRLCLGCEDSGNNNLGGWVWNTEQIFDARVYNYVLTDDEVKGLMVPSGIAPQITAQPISTYGNTGLTSQFSANVIGSYPLAYQWQVSTDAGITYANVNDVNVSGATTANLTFNSLQSSEAGLYRLVITNASGATNSSPVQLAVVGGSQVYTWQTPVSMNGLNAQQILDSVPGTYFSAAGEFPWGNTVTTTNADGTTHQVYWFDGSGAAATVTGYAGSIWWANPENGFTTGNSGLDGMLGATWYDGGHHLITIHNLTPGVKYSVQLFALDDRNDSGENNRQSNYQDPNNSADVSDTFYMGFNDYVIGTFTAIYPDMPIQQNLLTGGNGMLQGIVVRTLTPPTPVFTGGAPAITTSPSGQPQLVLTYTGTLLSATNVAGPFLPVAGATSPYTNILSSTVPDVFFELSNP